MYYVCRKKEKYSIRNPNVCEFIFFSKFKMLFYEMVQGIWTLEDHKMYLKTIINISKCYSQSVLKVVDVNKERFFLGRMKDLRKKKDLILAQSSNNFMTINQSQFETSFIINNWWEAFFCLYFLTSAILFILLFCSSPRKFTRKSANQIIFNTTGAEQYRKTNEKQQP